MRLVRDHHAGEDYLWWQSHDRRVLKRVNLRLRDVVRHGNEGLRKSGLDVVLTRPTLPRYGASQVEYRGGSPVDVSVVEVAAGVWQARAQHVCWVLITDGDGVTLVDTGYPGDRERVVTSLERIGRSAADVDAVVLTHAHPDHIGSAEYFRSQVGRPVWVHEQERANATGERVEQASVPTLLKSAWRPSVLVWLGQIGIGLKAARAERLGEVQTFDSEPIDVPGHPVPVHTPGHTSGHTAVHLPDRGALLAGDALMTEHALTTSTRPALLPDFFQTDTAQARASLDRLRGLHAEVVVPGHGPPFRGSPDQAVDVALRHS